MDTAVLLVSCPDARGIVAGIADFLHTHGANILHADEHGDADSKLFLMRVEWELKQFDIKPDDFARVFDPIASKFKMQWRVELSTKRPRMAVLASKYDHCLADLLYRHQNGELRCDIPLVVSNHRDTERWAKFFNIPFHHVPVTPETKPQAEAKLESLLADHGVDLVVLARYMQIIPPALVEKYRNRMINIHHSFLPAFLGGKPYHRAFERGVKLIGATSHYVTEELDEGPIIEQDVMRISHRDSVEDLIQKGRDLEKVILSRAVRWHLEHRVLRYGNKTVVFD